MKNANNICLSEHAHTASRPLHFQWHTGDPLCMGLVKMHTIYNNELEYYFEIIK
jgi:hypothetical protein